MKHWSDIRAWRVATRRNLIERRLTLSAAERRALSQRICEHLLSTPGMGAGQCVGFYWPIRGELDVREAITTFLARGASAALPVVLAKDAAMIFRPWSPGCAMTRGIWDIPVPDNPEVRDPDVLLIPLVGFDSRGYRLGYGGGFYDRTLAKACPRPRTIGVGWSEARLDTVYPQTHDIPLDAIVTESGWAQGGPNGAHARDDA